MLENTPFSAKAFCNFTISSKVKLISKTQKLNNMMSFIISIQ